MEHLQGNVIYRNLANIVSILGVLPLAALFMEDGYRYLMYVPELIIHSTQL